MFCRNCQFSLILISFLLLEFTLTFDSFMDNVYYKIDWPGPLQQLNDATEENSIVVTTNSKEKYKCILPTELDFDHNKEHEHFSPAKLELELLKSLFEKTTCTYRLETYWTYELCHGRHVRQYHEEKESGKKPILQEYFLGRYNMELFWEDMERARGERDAAEKDGSKKSNQKVKKVLGLEQPYYEVVYNDGTKCDLTGQPRKSAVRYVCHEEGRGEIYELKETSSCEYEVVVLSKELCQHTIYGPKKDPVHMINCHSLDGASRKPLSLDLFELQGNRFNSKKFLEDEASLDENLLLHNLWDMVQQLINDEALEADDEINEALSAAFPDDRQVEQLKPIPPSSKQIAKDFLNGEHCIEGGTGWWKHEFCFGKFVQQYHADKTSRTTLTLGVWDTNAHLLWLENNPSKRPKPQKDRKFVSLYYGGGNMCDETKKERFVEVRLKCTDGASRSNAIALYLLEPMLCEYKLVVESPVFCDVIKQADENGLIDSTILL